jgi:uncharacterized protein (DUF433 family)
MEHIVKTPGICGGRACIAGHRIRVMDIVVWSQLRGYSADIHAALAYYFDHRAEIDGEFQADEVAARELITRHPPKVKETLGG